MTRQEIIKLLEVIYGAYPHVKVKDAAATVSSWELVLSGYSAEAAYKAARLHIATNHYFPAPSDIVDLIPRAQLIYSEGVDSNNILLEPPKARVTPIEPEVVDEYLDAFCEMVGFGCDPDDGHMSRLIEEHPELKGILPYET